MIGDGDESYITDADELIINNSTPNAANNYEGATAVSDITALTDATVSIGDIKYGISDSGTNIAADTTVIANASYGISDADNDNTTILQANTIISNNTNSVTLYLDISDTETAITDDINNQGTSTALSTADSVSVNDGGITHSSWSDIDSAIGSSTSFAYAIEDSAENLYAVADEVILLKVYRILLELQLQMADHLSTIP